MRLLLAFFSLFLITGCNSNDTTLYASTSCNDEPKYRAKFLTDLSRQTVVFQVAYFEDNKFVEKGGYALENCKVVDAENFHCVGDSLSSHISAKPTWTMSNGIMIYGDISRNFSTDKTNTCWYKKKLWWYSKVDGVKMP
jgi:hypothetical protein